MLLTGFGLWGEAVVSALIAVVTDYINNASLNSNIDQEAVLNISAMVEGMMLQDREEWEL